MTPQHALDQLYTATRHITTNAETHEMLRQCYSVVMGAIQFKEKETENGATEIA